MLSLGVFFTGNVLTFMYFIPEMLTYSNQLQSLPPGANQVFKHQGLWRTWRTQTQTYWNGMKMADFLNYIDSGLHWDCCCRFSVER